jgi:hypothetical protein
MDRYERILEVPACYISKEVGNRIAQQIHAIVEEQATIDYAQVLSRLAPYLEITPEEAINRFMKNMGLRTLLGIRKDQTTFISPHGNVQFTGRDVYYEEIPMDTTQVVIDVTGINGKHINIFLTTNLLQNFPLHTANKILIQGNERSWVDHLHQEFFTLIKSNKKIFRNFIYRWLRPFGIAAFFALSILEFWMLRLFLPDFTLQTPLTGLSMLIIFFLLFSNNYLVYGIGSRVIQHLYPYFEIEDKLSHSRRDWRIFFIVTIIALYGAGFSVLIDLIIDLIKK